MNCEYYMSGLGISVMYVVGYTIIVFCLLLITEMSRKCDEVIADVEETK